ncbi:glutathione S-transferase family protein [Marinobacter sp. X15-166B]|uniref:glutathione S-transferase family protein n=1 Tax=Marinobacter sp. X15-166B TaxID=1897620 RepID=UPI00085C5D1F|nr:glutathione S-transferase N-terminal domain-containing protein [Marinobacter sp. X15-166B]OEY65770.1 glutathione S-transferase [Marinobacter sp. X15-166B]
MKLIGSTTSPYVRRIRLLLGETQYEFVDLDIYDEGRDHLRRCSPVLKVPVLIDGARHIYDSRVIARYLSALAGAATLTWEQENQLTVIDAANDAAVILLLSKRSGLEVGQDVLFYRLQRERLQTTLQVLADAVTQGQFSRWDYPAMCLFCLVDWLDFRQVVSFDGLQTLLEFRDANSSNTKVAATDPRQG